MKYSRTIHRRLLPALLSTLLLAPATALAQGDPASGKNHYNICAGCHGEQGLGSEDLGAPRLAGQHGWYLVRQLRNFRNGLRGTQPGDDHGALMSNFARSLPDDQAVLDVVSYIETLPR